MGLYPYLATVEVRKFACGILSDLRYCWIEARKKHCYNIVVQVDFRDWNQIFKQHLYSKSKPFLCFWT